MSNGGTLLEVEEQINALRLEQKGWEAVVQNAEELRVAAEAAEAAAISAQHHADEMRDEARAGYDACSEELDTQLTAWRTLVPQPRGAVE